MNSIFVSSRRCTSRRRWRPAWAGPPVARTTAPENWLRTMVRVQPEPPFVASSYVGGRGRGRPVPDDAGFREEDFREFVALRSKALLRTAYLLAGDWATAED